AGGGGSGGGVHIVTNDLVGSGSISARGGDGGGPTENNNLDMAGGGGGGRVAVQVLNSGSFCSLTINVSSGAKSSPSTGLATDGAMGTVRSTVTLASPPGFGGVAVSSTAINWSWNLVAGAQNYKLYSSTGGSGQSGNLSGSTTFYVEQGLLPNTTYTRYISASDCVNSSASPHIAVATLAKLPADAGLWGVYTSSVTADWTPFPAAPPEASSESASGYIFQVSTAADFTGEVFFASTTVLASSSLQVHGLEYDTDYYYRVGSLNWIYAPNYTVAVATRTNFYDCGLRWFDGNVPVIVGCEPPGVLESRLRMHRSGVTYGIPAVDLAHPRASRIRIMTPEGIKSIPYIGY
ncbi:MAG TPA: hypothetical protein PK523_05570, partial [Elusimicrobiales bacterium]|nr:hypothetical protein [Elusimicrobiales bacterium]